MLTEKPGMNRFIMWPVFTDGQTTFQPMQVVGVVGDRITVRSLTDFNDTHEFAFSDVRLGTSRFDSELRLANDIEALDAIRLAVHFHSEKAIEAARVHRIHLKCADELERLESHLPQSQGVCLERAPLFHYAV